MAVKGAAVKRMKGSEKVQVGVRVRVERGDTYGEGDGEKEGESWTKSKE